jgi:hypothetical protein
MQVLEEVDDLTADTALKIASMLIAERSSFKIQTRFNREFSSSAIAD